MQCGKYDGISALWKDPVSTIRLLSCLEYLIEKQKMKMLTCLISIGYRAEALGKERTHCEWGHFKDQIFCRGLRRQPDSLLLSAQRGAPGWCGGGGGTDRKTDSPCSVFPFSSVRWLVCVRAQTCSAPSEGYLKSRGFLVRLTQEGVEQAFVWVVVMKNAGGWGGKKREEGNMEEKRRMGAERPKIRL